MRVLLPLPVTVMASPARRRVLALEAERFRDAQARAVEQAQHRGIARDDPGLARFAGAQIGVGDALGGGDGQRLRQGPRQLGRAHGGERADLALAVALQEAGERARARQHAHQRAVAGAVAAPRRHEGAHIGGRKLGQSFQRWRPAQMPGEKAEELADVAPVGFQGLCRHAPLGAEIAEPAGDFGGHVGGGCEVAHGGQEWHRFLHPSLNARNRPDLASWPHALSTFWCRWRSTRPIPTGCRTGLELAPGDVVTVPLGARGETTGVVWAENANPNPRLHNRMKDVVGQARRAAAENRAAPIRRLGGRLHAGGARHGAAHGAAHGRTSRPGARTRRRAAGRAAARSA